MNPLEEFNPFMEIKTNVQVVNTFVRDNIQWYGIRYARESVFVSDTGELDTAGKKSEEEKAEILKRWEEYKNSEEGQEDIAEAKKRAEADL